MAKSIEIGVTVLLTTLFIQLNPFGLSQLNQTVHQLMDKQPQSAGRGHTNANS